MATGQPDVSDVHVNRPLSNILVAYMQAATAFMADKVFPNVPVQKQSDLYFEIEKDAFYRTDVEERAPGAETPGTGFNLNHNNSYFCHVDGVHTDVPDQVMANVDNPLNMDMMNTELLAQQMLIRREQKFITKFFGACIWSGNGSNDVAGVPGAPAANQVRQWNVAGSSPIEDVKKYNRGIQKRTGGFKANKLILGPYVADGLLENPEIVDRVKYTQLGFLDYKLLATAFGVDEVFEAAAVHNTANEGAPVVMDFMYPNSALLVYSAPAPGLMIPSGGYTFGWQGYLNGDMSSRMKRYRMEHLASWRLEAESAYDMRLIGSDLGVFFTDVIAS